MDNISDEQRNNIKSENVANRITDSYYDASTKISRNDFKEKIEAKNINKRDGLKMENVESSDYLFSGINRILQTIGFSVGSVILLNRGKLIYFKPIFSY